MGVNLFVPVKSGTYDENTVVDQCNALARGRFDWCDVFKGPGGHCLTMQQALAFEPEAAPWWVLMPNGQMRHTKGAERVNGAPYKGGADWAALLREAQQCGCDTVLFLKARN